MMIPSQVFSGAKIHKVEPTASTTAATTTTATRSDVPAADSLASELPNTFDELKSSYKWLREISEVRGAEEILHFPYITWPLSDLVPLIFNIDSALELVFASLYSRLPRLLFGVSCQQSHSFPFVL